MSTVESHRRVALLARPGAARDCVRAALLEVGVDLVAEEDPEQADPQAIRGADPQVLMIVLDAGAEDALGRFDVVIGDPAIEVMFEEADVALSREGWEAARWRRHLAAKLHRSGDVLPPTGEAAPAVDALSLQLEELMDGDAATDAIVELPADVTGGDDFSVFDPVAAEAGDPAASEFVLTLEGLELEAAAPEASEFDASAFDPAAFDASFDGEPRADVDTDLPQVTGPDFSASDFDPLLAELDARMPEPAPLSGAQDWNGDLVEDFADGAPPADVAPATSTFGELSLADDAAPSPVAPARSRGTHDLEDLERRISSLQLVDDSAPGQGVALVLAGMGGPDAVRQFLGGLPATFAHAVLVRQRLDGARYDKLVAQMQRATELPVTLAEAGRPVAAGTVYVMGDGLALDAANGLRFVAGEGLLESLPATGSAVVMLSGGDPGEVDAVAALASQGAWLGAQASEGCYDPAAAQALAARGAACDAPAELARQLARRWNP